MQWLLKIILDFKKKMFAKGKPLHKLLPGYEAMENGIFSPGELISTAPYARDPIDLKRYMLMVIYALLPALACGVYFYGLQVLAIVLVSYVAGGIVEVTVSCMRGEDVNEGFFVTGLIFPLTLPPTTPLWMVAVGVSAGVFLGKEIFGGTGRNPFNPALVGRGILLIAYPKAMASGYIAPATTFPGNLTSYKTAVDAVTTATPLAEAKLIVAGKSTETFSSISDLMTGNVLGAIGETSGYAIIIGGLFLLFTKVGNWRTVVAMLGSFALLQAIMGAVNPEVYAPEGMPSPVIWHLASGGLLYGAFFMATDPVTCPFTNSGKIIFGILVGLCAWVIRQLASLPEGITFAILMGNVFAPIIDEIVVKFYRKGLKDEF